MTRIGQSGRTIGSLLAARTAALGHHPLLIFYDDTTGERTELSYATFFNWASKAANLLMEELDLGRGGTVALDVTRHWTGAVVAVAAWMVGAAVVLDGLAEQADVHVVAEADAAGLAGHPGLVVVGAGMGGRLTGDAPGIAFGDEVLAFGDDFTDPAVDGDDLAVVGEPGVTQAGLLDRAGGVLTREDRLLVTAPIGMDTVAALLVAPALAGASVVWCPATGDADLASRVRAERVTLVLHDDGTTSPPG